MGLKVQTVCRTQLIFNTVPNSFHSQSVTCSVEMTVEASAHIILVEQLQNLRALVTLIFWGVMEKYDLGKVSGGL